MRRNSIFRMIAIGLLTIILAGCSQLQTSDQNIPGISNPIEIDGTQIKVVEAIVQGNYSVHYIMHYADSPDTFYKLTISIEGFEDPQQAIDWGMENFSLVFEEQTTELEHSRWILVGKNIQYEADEEFEYSYIFIFKINAQSDYTQFYLSISDHAEIQLASILKTNPNKVSVQPPPRIGTIGGGDKNFASGINSVVSGGSQNTSSAYHTTVSGGHLNTARVAYATVSGGRENLADNLYTTISGGYGNTTSGRDSTIGGGSRNSVTNYHGTIGGGIRNVASASDTTICGGGYNVASDTYATVCGGTQNTASGSGAAVGGGAGNIASNDHTTVAGGLGNEASGIYTSIGGGHGNLAAGAYSSIPGGQANQALGDKSVAVGNQAVVEKSHSGTFLFSDSQELDFTSETANEFAVRASGGARFVTAIDEDGIPTAGVILPPGSGSWSTLSDITKKEHFDPVNPSQILSAVLDLEILEWSYKSEHPSIRHIGPMAQDFYSKFQLGQDERYIANVDSDGITLASIQGLHQIIENQNDQIAKQQVFLDAMENQIIQLENQIFINNILLGSIIVVFLVKLFWNLRRSDNSIILVNE